MRTIEAVVYVDRQGQRWPLTNLAPPEWPGAAQCGFVLGTRPDGVRVCVHEHRCEVVWKEQAGSTESRPTVESPS